MSKTLTNLSTIIAAALLLAAPAAIWMEKEEFQTWQERLILPSFLEEPNRHTPIHSEGFFLPPVINSEITLSPDQGPIILAADTRISPAGRLILEPGTRVVAHEFAELIVEGTLTSRGTATKKVSFASNEAHPLNQTWNGINATGGASIILSHTVIEDASPAINCQAGSTVAINDSTILRGAIGIFSTSPNCTIANSSIQGPRDGLITIGVKPSLLNTPITARQNEIRIFPLETASFEN